MVQLNMFFKGIVSVNVKPIEVKHDIKLDEVNDDVKSDEVNNYVKLSVRPVVVDVDVRA